MSRSERHMLENIPTYINARSDFSQHEALSGLLENGTFRDDQRALPRRHPLRHRIGNALRCIDKLADLAFLKDLHATRVIADVESACSKRPREYQPLGIHCDVDKAPGAWVDLAELADIDRSVRIIFSE